MKSEMAHTVQGRLVSLGNTNQLARSMYTENFGIRGTNPVL